MRIWPLVPCGIFVMCGGAVAGETSMGEPCTPRLQTANASFAFDANDVYIETGTMSCPSQTCLVNHFQGRVADPYFSKKPQCANRRDRDAVYCSCRCANALGRTDDADTYCLCAKDFVCQPLVISIGQPHDGSGSYCMKKGTAYADEACDACDPAMQNCP